MCFAALVGIAFFTSGWVRGSLGDLLVVIWVASGLALVRLSPVWNAGLALSLAVVLELIQLLDWVEKDDPLWMHLIFGATFDPLDLLHYAIGAVVAWGVLTGLQRRVRG